MYRKSFLQNNHLRFQDIRSANDLCFTYTSLAIADRITTLDAQLVVYRRQNPSSLQSTQSKEPLAFYSALTALQNELRARGVWADLSHAYVNTALDICTYNLRTLRNNLSAQREVFDFLRETAFKELGIAGKPRSFFYVYPKSRYDDYILVQAGDFEQYRQATNPSAASKRTMKDRIRTIIPLRASVFEKSKKDLYKEIDILKEQNQDLSEKLSKCLELLQEMKQ